MSSRYGVGPYGINAYSAPTQLVGEGTVVGAYAVTNARGSVAVAGVATILAAYLLEASAKLLVGAYTIIEGEFSVYAEPRYASQVYGEAIVEGEFALSALGSVAIMREGLTVAAVYQLVPVEESHKFWNPDAPVGNTWWTVEQQSSVWTKIPDTEPVWRH